MEEHEQLLYFSDLLIFVAVLLAVVAVMVVVWWIVDAVKALKAGKGKGER